MTFSDEPQRFHLQTDTSPADDFDDETGARDDDMAPDDSGGSPNSLEDDVYPDDDDYEEIPEDDA